jgi:hypothetical protein
VTLPLVAAQLAGLQAIASSLDLHGATQVSGVAAVAALGDQLGSLAAVYNLPEATLKRVLEEDADLRLAADATLHYGCTGISVRQGRGRRKRRSFAQYVCCISGIQVQKPQSLG